MSTPQTSEFIAEAKEHLTAICDQLLRLERSGSEAASDRIESILRAAHSVKGGAGFFGLKTIEQIAHKMETVLEAALVRTVPTESQTIDVLLAATDRLAALLDDIEASNLVSVSDITIRLDELAEKLTCDANPTAPSVEHTVDTDSLAAVLPDITALSEAQVLFPIAINLTACQDNGITPIDIVELVLKLGHVEEGSIEAPGVDLGKSVLLGPVIWHATVASLLSSDEFHEQLNLPPYVAEISQPVSDVALAPSESSTAGQSPKSSVGIAAGTSDRVNSIRIPVELADRLVNLSGELVLVRNQSRRYAESNQPLPASVVQRFDAVTSDFQETVLQTRMQPVGNLFSKYPRLVRDLARQLGKQIELQVSGAEVELDKAILDTISDPLIHLVRNACDHGIERPAQRVGDGKPPMGRINLIARHEGDQICIQVKDDGRGVDCKAVSRQLLKQNLRTTEQLARMSERELMALILLPGFSTATQVTDVSGRGVGTDVVRTNLSQVGGTVEIDSVSGQGTTFTLRLPLTLAIIPGLLVTISEQCYAIPQKDLEELVCVDSRQSRARIEWTKEQEMICLRGRLLPLVRLNHVLTAGLESTAVNACREPNALSPLVVAIVRAGSKRFGLVCDRVLANEEIVVKPMHTRLRRLTLYSGATVLGDGRVALILNTEGIATTAQVRFGIDAEIKPEQASLGVAESQNMLVVLQSNGEPAAVPAAMIRRIVMVNRQQVEHVAEDWYTNIDGIPTKLSTLGTTPIDWSTQGVAFVLLPRETQRPIGWVVQSVKGIERVSVNDIHALPTERASIGATVLRGQITPLIDLQSLLGDADLAKSNTLPCPMPSKTHVLLVDDTQFFRDAVGRCLREAGYSVTTAEDGGEALERLKHDSFDIVVSDLEMPVLDGLRLASAVRNIEALRHLPLLALTTQTSEDFRDRARQHGFDAFEVKLDPTSLLATVRTLLQQRDVRTKQEETCHA